MVIDEPRRRLHPLSPLLRSAKALVVIVVALSWQTLRQVGLGWFALMVLVLLLGAIVMSVVSWYNTGYHVVGHELRVYEGLLWRRTRAIPLERLQSVEVVRPLLAQLTGLAELRLEVVGGGKTEAPLAYLSVADAAALRDRLLAIAGRPVAPVDSAAEVAGVAPVRVPGDGPLLLAVPNRDLVISQLLTPQALVLPIGVAFVVLQFGFDPSWSFIGVASTLTAIAGVLLQPVRRILSDWNFRLSRDDTALRLRFGLVETRSQTVPVDRVQGVTATWPLLWRAQGWLRLTLDVAGVAGQDAANGTETDRLLPVGTADVAERVAGSVLPGVLLSALAFQPPPERTRWFHPLARPKLGVALTDKIVATREGLLTRTVMMVPFARIQSVRVVQGPLQRLLGVATVYADTARGRSAALRDRDLAEAWWLAAELAERGRVARLAAPDRGRVVVPAPVLEPESAPLRPQPSA
ncbi:membrane protein [Asanoa ishikariensis]|uniref:Putative membrane protein n=1 Tax=Asanoa ishikariensis TaxID=137265 RepID=A0A1H3U152_9ACTN|nr:PH domain-containing protein [Asanoa ishikariensis]GIF67755.1 membrane protein [Asanoa ishikariensis]SDZ55605.1 putative membrane protein [Asanoa ishikariensis]